MAKPKLVLHPAEHTSFKSYYLRPVFEKYFDYTDYDNSTVYDSSALFVTNVVNTYSPNRWVNGLPTTVKILVDNLWEANTFEPAIAITNKNWFWYNESMWCKSLGYDMYRPNKTYSKLAFMPINLVKPHRVQLINNLDLGNLLDNFIYSFGDTLPGDIDKSDPNWQRYLNPSWYDDTYFSLVVETGIYGLGFATEKTFKPLAYYHPFLCYGQVGTLAFVKNLGFETFENLFDESYDTIEDHNLRLDKIIENVKNFDKVPYDKLTLEKLDHNHNLFFDTALVTKRIIEEIVYPMLEIANAN